MGRIIRYMARGLLLWFVCYWVLALAAVILFLLVGDMGFEVDVNGLRCLLILVAAPLAYLWEKYLDRDKSKEQ